MAGRSTQLCMGQSGRASSIRLFRSGVASVSVAVAHYKPDFLGQASLVLRCHHQAGHAANVTLAGSGRASEPLLTTEPEVY